MAFLAITGFFCFRAAAFTSGADFCAIWKAGSLLPLRFCVGPSLFESSAKVEAAGLVFNARRFDGMLNSNFNFEEKLLSTFFVSTNFTSRKALLVRVCLSNHSGLVGMSSIFETMIPPPLSFIPSPLFSSSNACFSPVLSDMSCFSILKSDPFCLTILDVNWSKSSFDFCGLFSSSFSPSFDRSTFSFSLLNDLSPLLRFLSSLSVDLTQELLEKDEMELKTLKSLIVKWLKEQKSCTFNQLGDIIFKFVSIPHPCEKCVFTKSN